MSGMAMTRPPSDIIFFFQNYGQYICQTEYFNTTTCSYSLGDYYFIYIFFLFVDSVSRLTCIEKVA